MILKKIINRLKKLFEKIRFVRRDGLHYIGGPDSLPPPLSPEKENELVERYTGVEQDIRSELIEHNLRLVVYIAKKFDNTGVGTEDLISIGTIGLIKAVNTFRADKNTKLATYGL